MSYYSIKAGGLTGEIIVPPSKSQTLRAILFGALAKGKTKVYDYLLSPDTDAMIEACRSLGAMIQRTPTCLEIEGLNGQIEKAEDVIQAGNSGIVLRFMAAVAALASHPIVITGDYSIRHQRPMQSLLNGLTQLKVSAISTRGDGYAPVIIQGPWKGGTAYLAGEDSQPISALLIASIFSQTPTELHVINPGEKPWVGLTLDWLNRLGVTYKQEHFTHYWIQGNEKIQGFEYPVPGDFSSAAFPLAAALITRSEITLKNLDFQDLQGDKQLLEVFRAMGAIITVDEINKSLHVKPGEILKGVEVDMNDLIDAVPILTVVACFATGQTRLTNAAIARQKECDRLFAITKELRKMGAAIIEQEDGLLIQPAKLKGADVDSHHDHRIAMSLAVAGLAAEGNTTVQATDCVSKTFSSFVHDFKGLGALIQEGQ